MKLNCMCTMLFIIINNKLYNIYKSFAKTIIFNLILILIVSVSIYIIGAQADINNVLLCISQNVGYTSIYQPVFCISSKMCILDQNPLWTDRAVHHSLCVTASPLYLSLKIASLAVCCVSRFSLSNITSLAMLCLSL